MPEPTLSVLTAAVRAHTDAVAPGAQEAVVTIIGPGKGESTIVTVRLDQVPLIGAEVPPAVRLE